MKRFVNKNKKKDARKFNNTANKEKRINTVRNLRGGIRL